MLLILPSRNDMQLDLKNIFYLAVQTIALLGSTISFGQIDLVNTSLKDSTQKILYLGTSNKIEVIGLDRDSSTVYQLENTKGIARIDRSDSLIFSVSKFPYQTHDTLRLFKGEDMIIAQVFKLETISDPIAQLGSIQDSTAKIEEILTEPLINVVLPDCIYKHPFSCLRFETSFFQRNGDPINTLSGRNKYLTRDQRLIIETLESGDRVEFTQLKCAGSDSAVRKLKSFTIYIE